MAPNDLSQFVAYIVGLVGTVLGEVGTMLGNLGGQFITDAANPAYMTFLTVGIFGENGGLIYWLNEKILWLIGELLNSLTFTYTP